MGPGGGGGGQFWSVERCQLGINMKSEKFGCIFVSRSTPRQLTVCGPVSRGQWTCVCRGQTKVIT